MPPFWKKRKEPKKPEAQKLKPLTEREKALQQLTLQRHQLQQRLNTINEQILSAQDALGAAKKASNRSAFRGAQTALKELQMAYDAKNKEISEISVKIKGIQNH